MAHSALCVAIDSHNAPVAALCGAGGARLVGRKHRSHGVGDRNSDSDGAVSLCIGIAEYAPK